MLPQWYASRLYENAADYDIQARHMESGRHVAVQVKTVRADAKVWVLGDRSKLFANRGEEEFHVLVKLRSLGERPDFFVVPTRELLSMALDYYDQWISGTKKDGSPRRSTVVTTYGLDVEPFRERWDLLLPSGGTRS